MNPLPPSKAPGTRRPKTPSVEMLSPSKVAKRPAEVAKLRTTKRSLTSIPVAEVAESVDPNKPLTAKAKEFIKYWAQGDSVVVAANKAGYADSATYAYKICRTPQAIALYNQEKLAYEAAAQMTRKQVMDGFLDGIEMAKLMAEPASVISGWREIAKMCGYFEPIKKNITLTVQGQVFMGKMEQMTDTQLMEILSQSAPEVLEEAVADDLEGL